MKKINRLSLTAWDNSKSKKPVSSILQDLRRWGVGVNPVEISSCTNKADWITKASMREEQRRGSPKLQHLPVYLLQNHS